MPEVIYDDLNSILAALPPRIQEVVNRLENRADLLEIVLDLGRIPEGRFPKGEVNLGGDMVTKEDLAYVVGRIGQFGDDNRAGIERTLHRISAIRNRRGECWPMSWPNASWLWIPRTRLRAMATSRIQG